MDDFGPDGTQAPPPPHLFPDSLAGLVTGDADPPRPFPDALSGPAAPGPPVIPQVAAQPVYAEPPRRPAHHKQTRRAPGPAPQLAPAWPNAAQAYQQRPVPFTQRPAVAPGPFTPRPPVGRQPTGGRVPLAQRPPMGQVVQQTAPKSGNGVLGCLVALLVTSGLLLTVLREVFEALVELFS
ncbi:hypothetical protein AB0I60_12405 [Actinosynnema sp. NPDC050436]|uniref:hypothetical protein n=1 Tax=Actinosynnema sp. NPDC050436 TaxID=3155659 RepID=UPI0033CF90B6